MSLETIKFAPFLSTPIVPSESSGKGLSVVQPALPSVPIFAVAGYGAHAEEAGPTAHACLPCPVASAQVYIPHLAHISFTFI